MPVRNVAHGERLHIARFALCHARTLLLLRLPPPTPHVGWYLPLSLTRQMRQVDTVRCVISIKGMDEQLGIMSTEEAIDRAQNEGLDLVMISADAEPPVVKIIDYGKFK